MKMIGSAGAIEAETELLVVENIDISKFSANIEEVLPITPGSEVNDIPAKEIKKRKDLRNECIFTIDPATAHDLDDALSIRKVFKHSVPGKQVFEEITKPEIQFVLDETRFNVLGFTTDKPKSTGGGVHASGENQCCQENLQQVSVQSVSA